MLRTDISAGWTTHLESNAYLRKVDSLHQVLGGRTAPCMLVLSAPTACRRQLLPTQLPPCSAVGAGAQSGVPHFHNWPADAWGCVQARIQNQPAPAIAANQCWWMRAACAAAASGGGGSSGVELQRIVWQVQRRREKEGLGLRLLLASEVRAIVGWHLRQAGPPAARSMWHSRWVHMPG